MRGRRKGKETDVERKGGKEGRRKLNKNLTTLKSSVNIGRSFVKKIIKHQH